MTFVELFIFVLVGVMMYFLLAPLRRRLEASLYRIFRSKMRGRPGRVIDITDYSKKDKKNE
jgi:hypothetical protein